MSKARSPRLVCSTTIGTSSVHVRVVEDLSSLSPIRYAERPAAQFGSPPIIGRAEPPMVERRGVNPCAGFLARAFFGFAAASAMIMVMIMVMVMVMVDHGRGRGHGHDGGGHGDRRSSSARRSSSSRVTVLSVTFDQLEDDSRPPCPRRSARGARPAPAGSCGRTRTPAAPGRGSWRTCSTSARCTSSSVTLISFCSPISASTQAEADAALGDLAIFRLRARPRSCPRPRRSCPRASGRRVDLAPDVVELAARPASRQRRSRASRRAGRAAALHLARELAR